MIAITVLAALNLVVAAGSSRADDSQYFYDPAGRLTAVVDPVNGSAQYNYDAVGNILSVVRRPITDVVVAQLSPSRGPAGTVITISGTGFGTTANTSVSFNGQSATPSAVTATQITVAVPAGATSGPISVTSPAGSANSVASFTVPTLGPPTVSGFSPSQADQGSIVTITGSNFDPLPANNKVLINDRYARVTGATGSSLTALVPVVSSGRVAVATPEGTATSTNYLVIPPLPYLASNIGSVVTSAIGSSATTTIGSAGKIGLILLDATAGRRLALQVTASTLGNGIIQLYGPDAAPIGLSANASNGSLLHSSLLPQTGTYAVVVAPGGTATGSVTVNLIDAPDVSGTIAANGTPVSLTTEVPGQKMVLTFSGTAGQRISLLAQGASGVCRTFHILQQNGASIFFGVSPVCGGNLFSDTIVLPTTGPHTIVFNFSGAVTGTQTFALHTVPPDVSGTIAANGTPVSLTTTAPGQDMVLTFSGTAGQRISLQAQGTGGGITSACNGFTILQPNGTSSISSASGCGVILFSDVLILPVTGTYTILSNISGAATGAETFTLYTVPPDVSGTIAANGTPVSLTTTVPGQNMVLTFSGTAGQRISAQTQAAGTITTQCSNLSIFQPDGVTKIYNNGCGAISFSDVLILPVTGSYTIAFNVSGALVGTVPFTLYNVPPDMSGTIATNGTPVSLTTTAPGQNMVLTFGGTAGQRISLQTQATGSITTACAALSILQPNGVTSVYSNGCGAIGFSDVLILPVTGSYTIAFNVGGAVTGTETFTLYDMPPDASATITPGGGSVSLTTTVPGQNMTLTFSGTAGQRIGLLVEATGSITSVCSDLSIFQPNGVTKIYSSGCGAIRFSDALTLPVTGTYTITLNVGGSVTGTETFTLYDVPADSTGTTSVGQAATAYSTTVPGQAIRVSFAGLASQSITVGVARVSSTPAGACYNITTLKPDGSTLRGDSSCGSSYSSGSLTLAVAGNYTIVVDPTSTSIGTFSIGVVTP